MAECSFKLMENHRVLCFHEVGMIVFVDRRIVLLEVKRVVLWRLVSNLFFSLRGCIDMYYSLFLKPAIKNNPATIMSMGIQMVLLFRYTGRMGLNSMVMGINAIPTRFTSFFVCPINVTMAPMVMTILRNV